MLDSAKSGDEQYVSDGGGRSAVGKAAKGFQRERTRSSGRGPRAGRFRSRSTSRGPVITPDRTSITCRRYRQHPESGRCYSVWSECQWCRARGHLCLLTPSRPRRDSKPHQRSKSKQGTQAEEGRGFNTQALLFVYLRLEVKAEPIIEKADDAIEEVGYCAGKSTSGDSTAG